MGKKKGQRKMIKSLFGMRYKKILQKILKWILFIEEMLTLLWVLWYFILKHFQWEKKIICRLIIGTDKKCLFVHFLISKMILLMKYY